jgi:hypothetical protein
VCCCCCQPQMCPTTHNSFHQGSLFPFFGAPFVQKWIIPPGAIALYMFWPRLAFLNPFIHFHPQNPIHRHLSLVRHFQVTLPPSVEVIRYPSSYFPPRPPNKSPYIHLPFALRLASMLQWEGGHHFCPQGILGTFSSVHTQKGQVLL